MKSQNRFYGLFIVSIGLFIIGTIMILQHYSIKLPDFVEGLCYGIGFAFEIIGIFLTKKTRKIKKVIF